MAAQNHAPYTLPPRRSWIGTQDRASGEASEKAQTHSHAQPITNMRAVQPDHPKNCGPDRDMKTVSSRRLRCAVAQTQVGKAPLQHEQDQKTRTRQCAICRRRLEPIEQRPLDTEQRLDNKCRYGDQQSITRQPALLRRHHGHSWGVGSYRVAEGMKRFDMHIPRRNPTLAKQSLRVGLEQL